MEQLACNSNSYSQFFGTPCTFALFDFLETWKLETLPSKKNFLMTPFLPFYRCGEMDWVDWEMTDLDGGYMYCCSLEDAASVLKEIASLNLQQSTGLIQKTQLS